MGQRKKESYVIRIDPKRSVSKRKITARANEIGIKMNIKILYSNRHKLHLSRPEKICNGTSWKLAPALGNWHKLQTCASMGNSYKNEY